MFCRLGVFGLGLLGLLFFVGCGSSDHSSEPEADAGDAGIDAPDPSTFAAAPPSCAYDCPKVSTCAENQKPYACPSLGEWSAIPHASACEAWDGGFPAIKGQCTATAPSGEGAKYAGRDPDSAGTVILPDGHIIAPAGSDWVFDEDDLEGGLTTFVGPITGTKYVVTVDDGPGDHAVRVIDPTLVGLGSSPVISYAKFAAPETLNSAATFVPPVSAGTLGTLYVATDDGVVQALTIDPTSGTLTRTDSASITLPPGQNQTGQAGSWYVAGLASSPDGTRLVVTGVFSSELLVYDVDPTSSTKGTLLGSLDLEERRELPGRVRSERRRREVRLRLDVGQQAGPAGRRQQPGVAASSRRPMRPTWTRRASRSSTHAGWSRRTTSATRSR